MKKMNYNTLTVSTSERAQFIDITESVQDIITKSGVREGICTVFVPHTTAAVTVNENADPDVVRDIKMFLEENVPWCHPSYLHGEGNSAAHIKSSIMGSSDQLIIAEGRLRLGTWQSIYFCEFDGPRTRSVWVKII